MRLWMRPAAGPCRVEGHRRHRGNPRTRSAGSLVIGMNMAKGLALSTNLPLIGVNHLEGHIYSSWIYQHDTPNPPPAPEFPLLALLVSGGHSELILMTSHLEYKRLGGTLDDAAGEAFDKVARLDRAAVSRRTLHPKSCTGWQPEAFNFPRSRLEGTWNFSFSGVKTAVLRTVRDPGKPLNTAAGGRSGSQFSGGCGGCLGEQDFARCQGIHACKKFWWQVEYLPTLRCAMPFWRRRNFQSNPFHFLCTDNAAMIAAAGYYHYAYGQRDPLNLDVLPTWALS